jgi:hypothetical protein
MRCRIGIAPECGLSSQRLDAAANVRFGSFADIDGRRGMVRSTLKSGHFRRALSCSPPTKESNKPVTAAGRRDADVEWVKTELGYKPTVL